MNDSKRLSNMHDFLSLKWRSKPSKLGLLPNIGSINALFAVINPARLDYSPLTTAFSSDIRPTDATNAVKIE